MNSVLPKVSVVTITYGHEKYITETLDGVLMQQYDGPVELIIANDNSPDATDEVVKKYFLENPAPSNFEIKYTKHETNKGMMPNFIWALEQATGKYIALCEGDDYWTDPLKLQKQVDFLENNTEYNICGHWQTTVDEKGCDLISVSDECSKLTNLATRCVVFRRSDLRSDFYENFKYYKNLGETYIYHYLSQYGKATILPFYGAAYRISPVGVYSMIGQEKQILMSLGGCTDMQRIFHKKEQYAIFEKITFRKAHFYNDYSLLKLSENKFREAISNNIALNKELMKLNKKAVLNSHFIKINFHFYFKLFKKYIY